MIKLKVDVISFFPAYTVRLHMPLNSISLYVHHLFANVSVIQNRLPSLALAFALKACYSYQLFYGVYRHCIR